jgi:hypothetical protein
MKSPACQTRLLSLALLLLALADVAVAGDRAGSELVVAKNQTYRVGTAQLQLKRLELQDGAVISFAPGITRALIHADRAIIGKDVRIDAGGVAGVAGGTGSHFSDPAPACEQGKAGGDGAVGGSGGNGIDLIVELGVERIGSLRIDAEGGAGGRGGNGGDGQRGGDIERCYGKNGGDGGNGGNGGVGGNGGAVTLRYWLHASSQTAEQTAADLVSAFSISVRGGNGGVAGSGGGGGDVVPGRYLSTAVGGGKKWLGAGEVGKAGAAGRAGNAGAAGSVSLMRQTDDAAVTKAPPVSGTIGGAAGLARDAGPDAEIRALRQQVEALERRVKALESAR